MAKLGERCVDKSADLVFFAHIRDNAPRLGERRNIGNGRIYARLINIRHDDCSSAFARKPLAEAFTDSACTARYNDDFIFNMHAAFSLSCLQSNVAASAYKPRYDKESKQFTWFFRGVQSSRYTLLIQSI